MNDPLEQQPYYKTEIVTTNLVTGEVQTVELHKTHAPAYTPVYRPSRPVELFMDHYLYGSDTLVGMTVELSAFPDESHDGTIGVFKVTVDKQE